MRWLFTLHLQSALCILSPSVQSVFARTCLCHIIGRPFFSYQYPDKLTQVTCGAELAVLYVETLIKGNYPYSNETLGLSFSFIALYNMIASFIYHLCSNLGL